MLLFIITFGRYACLLDYLNLVWSYPVSYSVEVKCFFDFIAVVYVIVKSLNTFEGKHQCCCWNEESRSPVESCLRYQLISQNS